MVFRLFPIAVLALLLAGCATTRQNDGLTQLQTRVGELEKQVGAKDEEIGGLRDEVKDLSYQLEKVNTKSQRQVTNTSTAPISLPKADGPIIRVSASAEKVQTALQNAGYYKGNIDGKVGTKTREAIAQFQRDKGLKPDGILGRATWAELQTFGE